eukprot:c12182_g1_i2.p2 GENE.c12182_g1_i2~~c12182_g1_i2.p2  ORF type:complete len:216 (+),score=49.90 c12182_g1_i2:961-1608(+)
MFERALKIIDRMRARGAPPDVVTWMTVLGPCRAHNNLQVAKRAFDEILAISKDPEHLSSAFVVLADVYRALGEHAKVTELHDQRLALGLHKQRGATELVVNGHTYKFYVGTVPEELSTETAAAIDAKLGEWETALARVGVSATSIACRHSEKLALAYAVLSGQKDVTLRKNLRVCAACHTASIALTQIEGIVIRHLDKSRAHIMSDGVCSCGGRY